MRLTFFYMSFYNERLLFSARIYSKSALFSSISLEIGIILTLLGSITKIEAASVIKNFLVEIWINDKNYWYKE